MSKNTAHRPSQSNQQYVKNSRGEKVLNTAYQGNTTKINNSDLTNLKNDFDNEQFNNLEDYYNGVLNSSLSPELPREQIVGWKPYDRSIEEYAQEVIEDYLEENPDSTLEEALDDIDISEIAMDGTDGELVYYSDQAQYFENASDEKIDDILDNMDYMVPNTKHAIGTDSTKTALEFITQDFYRDKYLQEHYGEDAYNLDDDQQDEADYAVEEYLEEKSEAMNPRNIIRMAYYDNESYPINGSQQEKEEFKQWRKEAEQFNDYVYDNYSYKESTKLYEIGNNNFENLNLKDELSKAAQYSYQNDAYIVVEDYFERVRKQL